MVKEDLHERGAMEIRKLWNFSDDAHVAEFLDGVAIFAILVTDEHHAVHRKFGRVESRQRQQSVIDGAESATRGEDDRQLKLHHHVQHELLWN